MSTNYFNLTLILFASFTFFLTNCDNKSKAIDVNYLKEGVLCTETIPLDFIDESGKIVSKYIDSVKFSYLDSIAFTDNNPDRLKVYSTPAPLDFTKKIEPYSPEYYMAYTVFNIIKVIEYYNGLFDNKIDFNSQEEYKTIEVTIGDTPYLTSPKVYIFEANSNPSPSLFFHEIGHRAFWYIEEGLGIKFKGLSYIHMGLLEYFTVSLNNSPLVGEDFLPEKGMRNADWVYGYPPHDSLSLKGLLDAIAASYPQKIQNPNSNVFKFYDVNMNAYKDYLDEIDNHRGGMIITSTLWRIREQLGQEMTDGLVARTILDLNKFMDTRSEFYNAAENEKLRDKIEWYDLYYGLIQKDKDLNEGKGIEIIKNEFTRTGFLINVVKL
ncbi:MAG: hypothetical protein VB074_16540 [Proteiniphilum sp.]|jgi:hypothetical protein|uniref:hypothetical protein n=1 Tax=Proteiniphilum sp. TaxID=1926877 RepID=UPI002B209042|nr:hypothetical protein [Proteiniphilum sp.]MEA5129786.1 hypothetical protein [Proteiniphilum sp.]